MPLLIVCSRAMAFCTISDITVYIMYVHDSVSPAFVRALERLMGRFIQITEYIDCSIFMSSVQPRRRPLEGPGEKFPADIGNSDDDRAEKVLMKVAARRDAEEKFGT